MTCRRLTQTGRFEFLLGSVVTCACSPGGTSTPAKPEPLPAIESSGSNHFEIDEDNAHRLAAERQETHTDPMKKSGASQAEELPTSRTSPIAVVAGRQLRLSEADGLCELEHGTDGRRLRTDVPSPCHFHLNDRGQPRSVTTPSGDVVIIVSSRNIAGSSDCDTTLQAIRTHEDRDDVELSTAMKIAMCAPNNWDEKVFTSMFANDG